MSEQTIKELPLDVAFAAIKELVEADEYNTLCDIYDQGVTNADAAQDAIENYQRVINEVVERLRSYR